MNMKYILMLVALLSLSPLLSQNYSIDSGHSAVQINVERFGVIDVVGRFKAVSGTIQYDAENLLGTTAQSVIQTNSYDANNLAGENAVKSAAFLDVENYPEITFTGNKTMVKDGKYYLAGELTIHGVTKSIELPYTIKGPLLDLPTQKQSIAFLASTTVNRQDYGISFDRQLPNGTKIVGDTIKITLTILAIEE